MFHNVPHCTWAVSVSELCIQHLQCLLQLCAGAQCNAHRPVLQFERGKKLGRKDRSISALHCCLIFAPWGEQTRRGYPVKAAWKRLTTQRKCILSEQIGVAFASTAKHCAIRCLLTNSMNECYGRSRCNPDHMDMEMWSIYTGTMPRCDLPNVFWAIHCDELPLHVPLVPNHSQSFRMIHFIIIHNHS